MQGFEFNTAPRLVCSPGSALELAGLCRQLGIQKPLLVTDPGLVSIGLIAPVQLALEQARAGTAAGGGTASEAKKWISSMAMKSAPSLTGMASTVQANQRAPGGLIRSSPVMRAQAFSPFC